VSIEWNVLVIDDQQGEEVKELLESSKSIPVDDSLNATVIDDFDNALTEIARRNFDFIVLDLKDKSHDLPDEESLRGKDVFDQVRQTKFAPIVFYTAFPQRVEVGETSFVKIVERGDIDSLEEAIKDVFDTRLIHLSRHIEEQKREFMWDFVETNWVNIDQDNSGFRGELAHTLARRLSDSLKKNSIHFFESDREQTPNDVVHPIEMYIVPPTRIPKLQAGDLVKESDGQHYLIITPTCDLVQGKAEFILRAKCIDVRQGSEIAKIMQAIESKSDVSKKARTELEKLIKNNRKGQSERYFFLPAVLSRFSDLVVDFQQLEYVSSKDYEPERLASLDSPFSELVVQKMSAFLGRIGTPDLNCEIVYDRLVNDLREAASTNS
jgi:hypothetical protein